MYLFMLLLFPVAFIFYIRNRFATGKKINWLVVIYGALVGIAVSGFKAFLMFRSHYQGSSMPFYVLDSWIPFSLVPLIFCGISYFLSEDDVKERFGFYVSYIIPFMSVYFTAESLSMNKPYPFFVLFVKPVLYLCMVLGIRKSIEHLFKEVDRKSKLWILDICLILVESLLPAIIEGIWYYQVSVVVLLVVCAAYFAGSLVRTITIKEIKTDVLLQNS